MRNLFLVLLISSLTIWKACAEGIFEVSDNYEDGGRYKNRLLKKILQNSGESNGERKVPALIDFFSSGAKYRLGYGLNYHRYDSFNSAGLDEGFYTNLSNYYSFHTDFYIGNIFSLVFESAFNKYKLKRYSGLPYTDREFRKRKISVGLNANIHNLFLYYLFSMNKLPRLYQDISGEVQHISMGIKSHTLGAGYRLPLFSIIVMDIFYQYERFSSVDLGGLEGTQGTSAQKFGFRAYSNTQKSFGVEVVEQINIFKGGEQSMRSKEFRVMPYYRF